MQRHYVYRVEEKITKEFYWGVRSCSCNPAEDKYMGSMIAWKPNKLNLIKTNIIEYPSREEANIAESIIISYYINKTKFPLNRNYYVHPKFCTYGRPLSEETKIKLSNINRGKPKPPRTKEHTEKLRQAQIGRKATPTAIENMRNAATGRKLSEEHKLAISMGGKGRTIRPHTKEEKEHLSKINKGKKMPEETKNKIRDSIKKSIQQRKENGTYRNRA